MHILLLPNELLELIFHDITKQDDRLALTLVCRRFREKVLPDLYRTISLNPFQGHRDRLNQSPISLLARSLLENPSLGPLIKHAHFLGWRSRAHKRLNFFGFKKPDPDFLELTEDYILKSGLPFSDFWISELEVGQVDAYAAIALSKMTGLRKLTLQIHQDESFLRLLLTGAQSSRSSDRHISTFDELRNVSILAPSENRRSSSINRLEINNILPLFYLPAVELLNIRGVDLKSNINWPGGKTPQCWLLNELVLGESNAKPRVLGQLLEATPQLQVLDISERLTLKSIFDSDWHDLQLDLGDLGDALLNVRRSLTKLTLLIDCSVSTESVVYDPLLLITNHLGLLNGFEKLVHLEISPICLFGSSNLRSSTERTLLHLPRSLETLSLSPRKNLARWGAREWPPRVILEQLGPILGSKEKAFPSLGRLIIDVRGMYWEGGWDYHYREMLEEMCEWASVKCRVID